MVDILLYNPSINLGTGFFGGYPSPLSLGYLSSYISIKGNLPSRILDCCSVDFPYYFDKYKPRIVGISAMIAQYNQLNKVVNYIKLKSPSTKVVVGGPLATFSSDELFATLKERLDFCVLGEGEETFLELCNSILNGSNDFLKIKGLSFLKNGKIVKTAFRNPISDLDALPFPRRLKRQKFAIIQTSRGCVFNCGFCTVPSHFFTPYRFRSPKSILSEIAYLNQNGIRKIHFLDDNPAGNPRNFYELLIRLSKWPRHTSFSFSIPPIIFIQHQAILDLFNRINTSLVSVGVETINKKDIHLMKIQAKNPSPKSFVKILLKKKLRFKLKLYHIVNTGYESSISEVEKKINEFFDCFSCIDNCFISPYLLQPIPGSVIYNSFKNRGILLPNLSYLSYSSNFHRACFDYNSIKANELNRLFCRYFNKLKKSKKLYSSGNPYINGVSLLINSNMRMITKIKFAINITQSFITPNNNYFRLKAAQDTCFPNFFS